MILPGDLPFICKPHHRADKEISRRTPLPSFVPSFLPSGGGSLLATCAYKGRGVNGRARSRCTRRGVRDCASVGVRQAKNPSGESLIRTCVASQISTFQDGVRLPLWPLLVGLSLCSKRSVVLR